MSRILFLTGFLFLAGFCSFPATAQQCTAYVNATDGDPGNSGNSPGSAKRSIEGVFNSLPSGAVVCVSAGEYFFDEDADGITFSAPGKSMTFKLNAFAGEDQVRLSESLFSVDVDSGVITFVAGTASTLIAGAGLANADPAGTSQRLTFMHSVVFTSGTVSLQGVDFSVEASVGVPGVTHPTNPVKVAPAHAQILFGDAVVEGALTFEPAPRTIHLTAQAPVATPPLLPESLVGATLVFRNSGQLNLTRELSLGVGSLVLDEGANVAFAGNVSVAGALSVPATFSGGAVFEADLDVSLAVAPTILEHLGTGSVDIRTLVVAPGGTSLPTVHNAGDGRLRIEEMGPSGRSAHVLNERGVLELGDATIQMLLSGSVVNASDGEIRLRGSVRIAPASSSAVLESFGIIDQGQFDLEIQASTAGHTNAGTIHSSTGTLIVGPGVSLTGGGSLGSIRVAGDGVVLDPETVDQLTMDPGSAARFEAGLVRVANSVTISTGATADFEDLEVAGDLLLDAAVLRAGTMTLLGGVNANADSQVAASTLLLSGTSLQRVQFGGAVLPSMILGGSGVEFLDSFRVDGDVLVESGDNLMAAGATVQGLVQIEGGSLRGTMPVVASFGGVRLNDSASLDLAPGSDLVLSGSLVLSGPGTLSLGGVRLIVAGSLGLHGQAIRLGALDFADVVQLQTVTVASTVTVETSLILQRGAIAFETGGRLELLGDLVRTDGTFEGIAPNGILSFSGAGLQRVEGFEEHPLPETWVTGAGVTLASDVEFDGSLFFSAGSSVLAGTTRVRGSLTIEGGAVDVGTQQLLVDGSTSIGAPGLSGRAGASLEVAGANVSASAGALVLPTGTLVLRGIGPQELRLPNNQVLGSLALNGTGSSARLVGTSTLVVRDLLQVGASDLLDLNATDLTVTPLSDAFANVTNHGRITQTTGKLVLKPAARGSIILGGAGIFGSVTVAMDADDRNIEVQNNAALQVSGTLDFRIGGIELGQGSLSFSDVNTFPSLRRNMADSKSANGAPDGRGLMSQGVPVGLTGDQTHDLSYYGSVSSLMTPGAEFGSNVRDLTITVTDGLNDPAVFGFQIMNDRLIKGRLEVGAQTLVRIDEATLESTALDTNHIVEGRVAGTGVLRLAGSGSLTSSEGTAQIGHLAVAASDNDALVLRDIGHIQRLDTAGAVVIEGMSDSSVTQVAEEITISGGQMTVRSNLEIGTNSASPRLTLSGGRLLITSPFSVQAAPGIRISADVSSSFEVVPSEEGADPLAGGKLVVSGNSTLDVTPSIPRLEFQAIGEGATSDDVFLLRDLTVTEALNHVDGDLYLGTNRLVLDGATWAFDSNALPGDGNEDGVFGELAAQGGSVAFIGSSPQLILGSVLSLESADLVVGLGSLADTLKVVGGAAIIQNSRHFTMESGVLDLGLSDLILTGVQSDVFRFRAGEIIGSGEPRLPSAARELLDDSSLFPYRNDEYGELVIGGSGASATFDSSARVQNFRLRGDTRLPASGESLIISGRLAFGRDGATLFSARAGQLVLDSGAAVVRQGRGVLTHRPMAQSGFDLFYDLDDGGVSGQDSFFGTGSLAAGNEARALDIGPRHLGVLAGGPANSVDFGAPLSLSGDLILYSGQASFAPGSLALGSGGRLALVSIDEQAPASLSSPGGFSAAGPISITLSSPFSDLQISDDLFPPDVQVDHLVIRAGDVGGSRTVSVLLQADRTVGHLQLAMARVSDIFNLNGRQLTVLGTAEFGPGIVTSGPVATLAVENETTIGVGSTIQGAVSATAFGNVLIEGRFAGLSLEAYADVRVRGDLGASTTLLFRGSEQELALNGGDETIAGLTLAQDSGILIPRVRMTSSLGRPVSLNITSQLTLEHGILETGPNRLILPPPPMGFLRTRGQSHVNGTVRRTLPAGTAEAVTFPVGGRTTYRPFTLRLPGLLVETDISVGLDDSQPVSLGGLPLTIPGNQLAAASFAPFSWYVTSSINFGQSLSYEIAAGAEGLQAVGEDSLSLIMQPGGTLADWTPAGTQLSAETDENDFQLKTSSVVGGLLPAGTRYAVGLPAPFAENTVRFQAVHINGSDTGGDVDLLINNTLGARLTFGDFTVAAPVVREGAPFRIGLRRAGVSVMAPPLAVADVDLAENQGAVLVLVPGGSELAVYTYPDSTARSVLLVNGIAGEASASFTVAGVSQSVEVGGATVLPDAFEQFDLSIQSESGGQPDVFRIDLSAVTEGSVVLAASGIRGSIDNPIQVRGILPDGTSIDAGAVSTTSDAPDLPTHLTLSGNYPNPFNPSTTIGFDLPRPASVVLRVFDVTGRQVAVSEPEERMAGFGHTLRFNGARLASGLYLYRLEASSAGTIETRSGRFVLIK